MIAGKRKTCFVVLLFCLILAVAGCGDTKSDNLDAITGNVIGPTEAAPSPQKVEKCEDSDYGDEPTKAGTTSFYQTSKTDTCDRGSLLEYYCEKGQIIEKPYACKFGCEKGVCLTTPKPTPEPEPVLTPEPVVVVPYNESAAVEEVEETKVQEEQEREEVKQNLENEFYNCNNGYKDHFETDVDCGGPCRACGYGQMCEDHRDCATGKCNVRSKKCLHTVH